MLASAARADVGVQCWENEFNSAACYSDAARKSYLERLVLALSSFAGRASRAQTDPIMIEQLSSSTTICFRAAKETDWKALCGP